MITIVGWLWQGKSVPKYRPYHANVWARMIHRHLTIPHRFVLMTDVAESEWEYLFDRELINAVPLWSDWRNLINNNKGWGENRANCYVRLKAFSEQAREVFGDRFVSVDLDCLVLDSLDPLFQRKEDFLIFRRQQRSPRDQINPYQASMWMMNAGARKQVWEEFKGEESIALAKQYMGSDQAWIRHILGDKEAGWTETDGVYSWTNLALDARWRGKPPANARIIFFHGGAKPWQFPATNEPICQNCGANVKIEPPFVVVSPKTSHPWIGQNYC